MEKDNTVEKKTQNKTEYKTEKKQEKPKCKLCGKTLVAIGTKRENGKNHIDWKTRQYHKKCYFLL